MWFKQLMGFEEISHENVQKNISVEGAFMTSFVNGKKYRCGYLEVPALKDLRNGIDLENYRENIKISETVGDVAWLHKDEENNNAVFQAASQFNLLEMVHPGVTPESGVDIYENDRTQGPACAVSCGAGTVFRNYFAQVNGKTGQTAANQIDCLTGIGQFFENEKLNLWKMKNGYAMFSEEGLRYINDKLSGLAKGEWEDLKARLKVGIQWNTEVTTANSGQTVTQVYCSALPVGYHSVIQGRIWENFARLILEAAYEATFYAAVKNLEKGGSPRLFLTLVGGGVFGNEESWILDAIRISVEKFRNVPLDVRIVSYGKSDPKVAGFIQGHNCS
ncbi:hypothetical protein [Chryseobacterium taklimakanense]|uniref:hypothetical protein n=1 Tax=Chryseobacterium taklimakanense TaxID=536441 RepID=UPI0023F97DA7|nr:hypothetical protein [Chryseobacterium taklimakanense]